MLNSSLLRKKQIMGILMCCLYLASFGATRGVAKKTDEKGSKKQQNMVDRLESIFDGFAFGAHERIFPYASLEDWFDPYGGLKLEHRICWNSADRMIHHVKFETYRDYSWKIRYLAHSFSTEATKFSFLFKIKFDQDAFFYGIGNSTSKRDRLPATYASVFFGTEVSKKVASKWVFRWSPGYWHVRSGLVMGGEFEKPASAKFITSRFAFGEIKPVNYRSISIENRWSSYVEIGIPVNSTVSSYARINFQTSSRIPVYRKSKLGFETRIEFLLSTDRDLTPYFVTPEVGSRNGLRGFSKERFRNFALAGIRFEYSIPLSRYFESFVLMDAAQTASNLNNLPGKSIHKNYGLGLRVVSLRHPLSLGMARSSEGWKMFSNINIVF